MLEELLESKIDELDAIKTAQKLPLAFKQEIAKAIARKGFKINRKSTFAGSGTYEKANKANKLYAPWGGVGTGASYNRRSDNPQEIEIFIYDTFQPNSTGDLKLSLTPDTIGNVKLELSSYSSSGEYKRIVPIAGKTVREFVTSVALETQKMLNRYNNYQSDDTKEVVEEDFLEDAESFVHDLSDKIETGIERDRYSRINDKPSAIYFSLLPEVMPKNILNNMSLERQFFRFLDDAFEESYIKSAYKKATGESAGKKGDRFTISSDLGRKSNDIFRELQLKYSFPVIKEILLSLKDFAKSKGRRISYVSLSDEYQQARIIIKFSKLDTSTTFTERPNKGGERFNVYSFLKKLKSDIEEYDEKERAYKFVNKVGLPVSKQLFKHLFKEK